MNNTSIPRSLQDLLSESLPKDVPFTFYHYSTPPTKSPALFSAPPHRKPEKTYCESHLLAASITPKEDTTSNALEELLILAIEVLIYSTKNLTTIFVSKADSTGYITALNLPRSQGGSPLKTICGIFVSWLARERQQEGKKLVVSLFARAQDQYLFPASIDNPQKHVLDDRGLVKWWCRVLDPLIREYALEEAGKPLTERLRDGQNNAPSNAKADTTAKGYLVIPGYETYDTLRYIPAPPSSTAPRRWVAAHPLQQIAPNPGAPPRCLVPHFPDDPKSRFLDELDEELPDSRTDDMTKEGGTPSRSNGQWKSVKTLDQFWEMMAFRQECSSGRIVGFIWVVITPPEDSIPEEPEEDSSQPQSQQESQEASIQASIQDVASPRTKKRSPKSRRRKVNTNFGPIPLLLPRIKSNSSNLSSMSTGSSGGLKLPAERTPHYIWPKTSRGTILFSTTAYNRAHEIMLQQNFATRTAAARSTKRWKVEIGVLGGVDAWGWQVTGQKEGTLNSDGPISAGPSITLVGARKKRKPETGAGEQDAQSSTGGVQVLGANLVRKKVKTDESSPGINGGVEENGVNLLGAAVVRRKPKT